MHGARTIPTCGQSAVYRRLDSWHTSSVKIILQQDLHRREESKSSGIFPVFYHAQPSYIGLEMVHGQ